jgi:hypothetical protein
MGFTIDPPAEHAARQTVPATGWMVSQRARTTIKARGSRWAVCGTIRPGECCVDYADDGDGAERLRDRYTDNRYYMITVYPPQGSADLEELRKERIEAQAVLDDVTGRLRAACVQAVADGRSESEVARSAGVDRSKTLRVWLGKASSNG